MTVDEMKTAIEYARTISTLDSIGRTHAITAEQRALVQTCNALTQLHDTLKLYLEADERADNEPAAAHAAERLLELLYQTVLG